MLDRCHAVSGMDLSTANLHSHARTRCMRHWSDLQTHQTRLYIHTLSTSVCHTLLEEELEDGRVTKIPRLVQGSPTILHTYIHTYNMHALQVGRWVHVRKRRNFAASATG